MYKPYPDFAMLHGIYLRPDNPEQDNDAIVAAIKNVKTGEKKLHIINKPNFEFWVTKKPWRNQSIRLECEKMNRLDQVICKYSKLNEALARALGLPRVPYDPSELKKSVYLYGVDVGPLIRMKIEYNQSVEGVIPKLDIGMLDIETAVPQVREFPNAILCASYTDWSTRTTFEFILDPWCHCTDEEIQRGVDAEVKVFEERLNDKALKVWKEQPHKFKFIHCKTERELIIELVRTAILCKPDLCGVWNIGYDIPYIEQRALFNQIPLEQLFCHPDVPNDLRMFKWKEDSKPVDHFTDKWHQVIAPGYTRWYDPMCLYSRLRKVQGRENFYTLEYIGQKLVGSGKVKFGSYTTHAEMQLYNQLAYCVYNCFDTILPCVMDAVTQDTTSMMVLIGISELSEFSKQTVMLKNAWFDYCRSNIDSVSGSIMAPANMSQNWDNFLCNIGGAVLSPNMLEVRGTRHMKEMDVETSISMLVNDIDAASLYPSIQMSTNLSRISRFASVLWIEGAPHTLVELKEWLMRIDNEQDPTKKKRLKDQYKEVILKENFDYIENFFEAYFTPIENAVRICHEHFNLPNFEEIDKYFS